MERDFFNLIKGVYQKPTARKKKSLKNLEENRKVKAYSLKKEKPIHRYDFHIHYFIYNHKSLYIHNSTFCKTRTRNNLLSVNSWMDQYIKAELHNGVVSNWGHEWYTTKFNGWISWGGLVYRMCTRVWCTVMGWNMVFSQSVLGLTTGSATFQLPNLPQGT